MGASRRYSLQALMDTLFALIVANCWRMGVFVLMPTVGERFDSFINQLPVHEASPYKRVWNGGIDAFHTAPVIGIGPTTIASSAPKSQREWM